MALWLGRNLLEALEQGTVGLILAPCDDAKRRGAIYGLFLGLFACVVLWPATLLYLASVDNRV